MTWNYRRVARRGHGRSPCSSCSMAEVEEPVDVARGEAPHAEVHVKQRLMRERRHDHPGGDLRRRRRGGTRRVRCPSLMSCSTSRHRCTRPRAQTAKTSGASVTISLTSSRCHNPACCVSDIGPEPAQEQIRSRSEAVPPADAIRCSISACLSAMRLATRAGEQLVLVREVVIDGRFGDAGVLGDVLDADPTIALAQQQLERRRHQGARTIVGPTLPAWIHGRGGRTRHRSSITP